MKVPLFVIRPAAVALLAFGLLAIGLSGGRWAFSQEAQGAGPRYEMGPVEPSGFGPSHYRFIDHSTNTAYIYVSGKKDWELKESLDLTQVGKEKLVWQQRSSK